MTNKHKVAVYGTLKNRISGPLLSDTANIPDHKFHMASRTYPMLVKQSKFDGSAYPLGTPQLYIYVVDDEEFADLDHYEGCMDPRRTDNFFTRKIFDVKDYATGEVHKCWVYLAEEAAEAYHYEGTKIMNPDDDGMFVWPDNVKYATTVGA